MHSVVDRIRRKVQKGEEGEETMGRKKYDKCVMAERRPLHRQLLAELELQQFFCSLSYSQRTTWEKSNMVLVKRRASGMLLLIQGWAKSRFAVVRGEIMQ